MSNQPELLARLAAESAIHRLHATYIHHLDSGDFAGVAEVLQHAVIHVLGNEASSVEGLLRFFEAGLQVHADGTPRTWPIVQYGDSVVTDGHAIGMSK